MAKSHEQQRQRRLEFQHFGLKKVKTTKDGLSAKYFELGGSVNEIVIVAHGEPHPHFTKAMSDLAQYYALSLGLVSGWDFAREALRGNDELLKEAIIGNDREIARCQIVGVSYLGDGDTAGAKIHGSLKCDNNWVKCDTPKVPFATDKLGYEKTLEKLVEFVRAEAYNYIFNNKRAQEDIERQTNGDADNDIQPEDLFKDEKTK